MKNGFWQDIRIFAGDGKDTLFSLGEGDTPLVKSNQIVQEIGCKNFISNWKAAIHRFVQRPRYGCGSGQGSGRGQ